MNCMTCYYGEPHYNRNGVIVGVDCSKDNMRFIDYDIAHCQFCGAYAERDEE